MIRLTAFISGNVQRAGYRAKVVSLANEMGLVGIVENQSDGRVLVIAESENRADLERFASAIVIKNALIHVNIIEANYTPGSGMYSNFRKITGAEEVGERLDEGIEILKEMLIGINNLTTITTNGFGDLTAITTDGFRDLTAITKDGFENLDGKMNQVLDKQDATIGEMRELRGDLKGYMDMRFSRIEADLAELKEMKAALKEKGLI